MKLCLIRSLREDRTLIASNEFIKNVLGKEYVDPVTDNIKEIWAET